MKTAWGILASLWLATLLSGCGGGGDGNTANSFSAPTNNAALSGLDLSPGVLEQIFQPTQTDYTATVGYLSPTTSVTPMTSDAGLTVRVKGVVVASGSASEPIPLAVGENLIQVDVATEDDSLGTGSYRIMVRRQTESEFAQQAYLKASTRSIGDQFGNSLALSGDTLAVGVHNEDSEAIGIDGNENDNSQYNNSGAVYIFTRSGTQWSRQAYIKASNTGKDDHFGISVALSGDTLAVGAYAEDSEAIGIDGDQTNNNSLNSGAVYVYTRSGTQWSQQAYLKASNTGSGDNFGYSVALAGDTLAVGAYAEDSNATGVGGDQGNDNASNSGAVYVYTRSGTQWSQQAYIKGSNTGSGDNFGYSVALAGDTLAVGANLEDSNATGVGGDQGNDNAPNSGAVYVYTRNGTLWSQQAYIKASNAEAGDFFGWSLSLSGDTLAVGAVGEASSTGSDQNDNSQTRAGAVYVLTRGGVTWSQQAYIKAPSTGEDDFGWYLALSGDNLAVGAPREDSISTGINGNPDNDLPDNNSGAVYLFRRNGADWGLFAYIKSANPGDNDLFGYSISLDGDTLSAGTPGEDDSPTLTGTGATFIFR
jgi:hypothetical protein